MHFPWSCPSSYYVTVSQKDSDRSDTDDVDVEKCELNSNLFFLSFPFCLSTYRFDLFLVSGSDDSSPVLNVETPVVVVSKCKFNQSKHNFFSL